MSSAIVTALFGAEERAVKLQKSLFSGIETHSRDACRGVARLRKRCERASSETMPPFDDVNANPERKERFDGALVNCGARRAAIATLAARPRKKPHKPPLHTHNWRIGRASEATPLNGPGVTICRLRLAPASGISALTELWPSG